MALYARPPSPFLSSNVIYLQCNDTYIRNLSMASVDTDAFADQLITTAAVVFAQHPPRLKKAIQANGQPALKLLAARSDVFGPRTTASTDSVPLPVMANKTCLRSL